MGVTTNRGVPVEMSQSSETCVGPIETSSTCKPEIAVQYA